MTASGAADAARGIEPLGAQLRPGEGDRQRHELGHRRSVPPGGEAGALGVPLHPRCSRRARRRPAASPSSATTGDRRAPPALWRHRRAGRSPTAKWTSPRSNAVPAILPAATRKAGASTVKVGAGGRRSRRSGPGGFLRAGRSSARPPASSAKRSPAGATRAATVAARADVQSLASAPSPTSGGAFSLVAGSGSWATAGAGATSALRNVSAATGRKLSAAGLPARSKKPSRWSASQRAEKSR